MSINLKIFIDNIFFQSAYKRPQLRKGALPSINLRRHEKPHKEPRQSGQKRRAEDVHLTDSPKRERTELTEKIAEVLEENVTIGTEQPNSLADLFQKILSNKESISIPISWGRNQFLCEENKIKTPAISFLKLYGRKDINGCIKTICEKEVTFDNTMKLFIKVNEVNVDHKDFGIENNGMTSVDEVENAIKLIDRRKVCQGCPKITCTPYTEHLLSTFTHSDKAVAVRHNQCSLLLPINIGMEDASCKACKSVEFVLNKKIIRRQNNKNANYLSVANLSPRKRERLLKLKKQLTAKGRAKVRAQQSARLLREVLRKSQEKMMLVEENSINDLILKNKKISANEKIAIQEILKASKANDPRGRRFSDEWIVLCVLLHMRSPVTYRMIRDLKILPIPCDRTVRR